MSAPHHQPPHEPLGLARQLAAGRRTSRRRRRTFGATVGLAAVAAMALVACDAGQPLSFGPRSDVSEPDAAPASATTSTPATTSTTSTTPTTTMLPPADTPDGEPVADEDLGDGGTVELDPIGDEPSGTGSDPCDAGEPGAALLVGPDPAVLEDGDLSSSLTITNCGDEHVDWTAATIPTVALSNAEGNLGPGSSSELAFDIDASAYEPGAIQFKVKVSEPGVNHYIDVYAFRQTLGGDVVADVGLTAGEGAGGCALQCITTAWLTGNATTPNVDLHVETNTPALIEVWVSDDEPDLDDAPTASSGELATDWSTLLSPLEPATSYQIVVRATDEHDHSATQSSSFMTTTPVDLPDEVVSPGPEPGCAHQCITTATVTPQAGSTEMALHVETHTPASLAAFVSPDPIDITNLDDTPAVAQTGDELVQSWDTVLSGLAGETTYHIVVTAIDGNDHTALREGTFDTEEAPNILVTFHEIHVERDGDDSDINRGELSFRWGLHELVVGSRGEDKLDDGATVTLDNAHNKHVIQGVGTGFLPPLYVNALERDADGWTEFCSAGDDIKTDSGRQDDCDLKWNVASSGLITVESLDNLYRCTEFGLPEAYADTPCLRLVSPDVGDDYPEFWAIVSFHRAG